MGIIKKLRNIKSKKYVINQRKGRIINDNSNKY